MKPAASSLLLFLAVGVTAADTIIFTPDSEKDADKYRLPDNFLFGAGTSAYQTEGAWNVGGKGPSMFDHYYNYEGHESTVNANVAADAYHHIDDDIELIRQLKLQVYRFSLSWPRLFPKGNISEPNPDGIRYYNEIIDKLTQIKVEPMITLYHFDHPYELQVKYNSWFGDGMAEAFAEYADFAFNTFGDRVKYWTTINEPVLYCSMVSKGLMVPWVDTSNKEKKYTCIHNQLLAHGLAYRVYQATYASKQGGKVGMSCYGDISRPNSTSYEDIQASWRYNQFGLGLCTAPAVFGDYSEFVKETVDRHSKEDGLQVSRLPNFTEEQKEMMKNASDFVGINVYFGHTVADKATAGDQADDSGFSVFDSKIEAEVIEVTAKSGTGTFGNSFSMTDDWAMHVGLVWARDNLNNIPVFITESGYEGPADEGIHDQARAVYHSAYIRTLARTANENGANVIGMTAWALLDDFEWSRGFSSKMGLVHVDYSSPERTRTLKDSSAFYIKLATDRRVPLVLPVEKTTQAPTTQRTTAQPIRTEEPTKQPTTFIPIQGPTQPSNSASLSVWNCQLAVVVAFVINRIL